MKKTILLLITFIFIVSGCSGNVDKQAGNNTNVPSDKNENISENVESHAKDESTNQEDGEYENDGKLTKVGQTKETPDGTIELLKIKEINETIQQGPLNINLIDAKLLKQTNLSSSYKSYVSQFTSIDDEFIYLQLQYNVENTTDKNIYWEGLNHITTDQKEQVDARLLDLNSFNINYDFYGNVKHDYLHGLIIENPKANSINLIFGSVYTNDDFEKLAEGFEYEFVFE